MIDGVVIPPVDFTLDTSIDGLFVRFCARGAMNELGAINVPVLAIVIFDVFKLLNVDVVDLIDSMTVRFDVVRFGVMV